MQDKVKDYDSFENAVENSFAQLIYNSTAGSPVSPANEFAQQNSLGIETNDNLSEKKEKIKKVVDTYEK